MEKDKVKIHGILSNTHRQAAVSYFIFFFFGDHGYLSPEIHTAVLLGTMAIVHRAISLNSSKAVEAFTLLLSNDSLNFLNLL